MASSHRETSVVLSGHSFTRRLYNFMESAEGFKDLRFDNQLFEVESRFQGGLTVERLIHERGDLFTFDPDRTPDIVYL